MGKANNFSLVWRGMSVDYYSGVQGKFWRKYSGRFIQTINEI